MRSIGLSRFSDVIKNRTWLSGTAGFTFARLLAPPFECASSEFKRPETIDSHLRVLCGSRAGEVFLGKTAKRKLGSAKLNILLLETKY
jgi:hypothetical protein